jgi:electron transfer flavoprotein alpha/beta subunit
MTIAVWLGSSAPVRSVRWLDGACATAAKLGEATAIAAGAPAWLDLAADRATRAGLACVGVATDLELDYLGWAQVVAATVRLLGATLVLVDEASRPERFPEVAAVAELLDTAQLTHAIAIAADGALLHATRTTGREIQTLRVRGPVVIGLRVAAAPIGDYPTPAPSAALKRLDLAALGLDPGVLGHRAVVPRAHQPPRQTVERVADYVAGHVLRRHEDR